VRVCGGGGGGGGGGGFNDATEGPRAPAVKPGLRKLVREGRVEPVQRD